MTTKTPSTVHMSRRIGALANALLLLAIAPAGCGEDEGFEPGSSEREQSEASELESPDSETMPVYVVVDHGIDAGRAAKLAAALGVGTDAAATIRGEDGAVRYVDLERFQKVPGLAVEAVPADADEHDRPVAAADTAVDLDALKVLGVPSDEDALAKVERALAEADIALQAKPTIGHSVFSSFDDSGAKTIEAKLDTQVIYERWLDGHRIVGPGAKSKVVLDPEGRASQITLAVHELERGEDVAIIPASEAPALCAEELGGGDLKEVTAELVYYAPDLSRQASTIFPHYACGGTRLSDGREVELRKVMIPAVQGAPEATMKLEVFGNEVHAVAEAFGGTAPYTYAWASSTSSLEEGSDSDEIDYAVATHTGGGVDETLTLYVTDANGLVARATETTFMSASASQQLTASTDTQQQLSPWGSIGTEWIGTCGGLGGSAGNAGGFVNRFSASGIAATFNWGEHNAWEIDFKDPIYPGGQDTTNADSVDLVFYTGHAAGDGFQFCSSVNDTWLDLGTEAELGNNNMEWLVIAACGPLQGTTWASSFAGLHLLLGYTTISWDNTTEGNDFASGILAGSPLTVRASWGVAATNSQPPEVIYGYGGVWAWSGSYWFLPNIDDYFWGMGSTGGDYQNLYGTWSITSPS
jgi:hypothetical protein